MATFYVREGSKRYRPAQESEVLKAAADVLGRKVIGQPLTSPEATKDFLRMKLAGLEHEVFSIVLLDQRHRVIAYQEIFRGTINGTAVYPREVVKISLACNAAAVILVHNHPSGVAEPSRADELLTVRLKEALTLVDIRVLDHLVIGKEDVVSFADRGLI